MTSSNRPRHSLTLRIRIAAVSLLSLIVTTACSLLHSESTPTPDVLCYVEAEPTNTPPPIVTCYTAPPPTDTPTPTTFTSPLSPLPTPTPTPTLTPEARRLLLDELLAKDRFPQGVVRQLAG